MPSNKVGLARRIDAVLAPLGFGRQEAIWNRKRVQTVDVLDLQVAKHGGKLTVNVGVLVPLAYSKVWRKPPTELVGELECTVRSRLGFLIDGHDHWWPFDAVGLDDELAEKIAEYAVPFFDRLGTPDAVEKNLADSGAVKHLRPPQTLYLAVLRYERGDRDAACELLRRYRDKAKGDLWKTKADELMQEFSC
jgi:hypothetical protein